METKPLRKRWWFWVLVIIGAPLLIAPFLPEKYQSKDQEKADSATPELEVIQWIVETHSSSRGTVINRSDRTLKFLQASVTFVNASQQTREAQGMIRNTKATASLDDDNWMLKPGDTGTFHAGTKVTGARFEVVRATVNFATKDGWNGDDLEPGSFVVTQGNSSNESQPMTYRFWIKLRYLAAFAFVMRIHPQSKHPTPLT